MIKEQMLNLLCVFNPILFISMLLLLLILSLLSSVVPFWPNVVRLYLYLEVVSIVIFRFFGGCCDFLIFSSLFFFQVGPASSNHHISSQANLNSNYKQNQNRQKNKAH